MRPRVLVGDSLPSEAFDDVRAIGADVDLRPDLTPEGMATAIPGAKVLVVRSTRVTAETIANGDTLALIVRAGSGTNSIDVPAASARGIFVSNCPGKNSAAVAELAIGLMLALDRRIPDSVIDLRRGVWAKGLYSKAQGLKGRRLGLVGFGSIASEVAQRARAFEMPVIAYSRSLTEEEADHAGITRATSLAQLFRTSEIVSIHLPLSPDTKGLVNRELLTLMPKGALFINTSRAEVVDHQALLELAQRGAIRVGTDVFPLEPEGREGAFKDPLGAEPNVYGTHHIGASTAEAQGAIAQETVRIVKHFLETGEVIAPVNVLLKPPYVGTLVVRHLDKVGVLASVLAKLKGANINVENMENVIFTGGKAACARIRVGEWPRPDVIAELGEIEHVLHVEIV